MFVSCVGNWTWNTGTADADGKRQKIETSGPELARVMNSRVRVILL